MIMFQQSTTPSRRHPTIPLPEKISVSDASKMMPQASKSGASMFWNGFQDPISSHQASTRQASPAHAILRDQSSPITNMTRHSGFLRSG